LKVHAHKFPLETGRLCALFLRRVELSLCRPWAYVGEWSYISVHP